MSCPYTSDTIFPVSLRELDFRLPTGFLPGFRVPRLRGMALRLVRRGLHPSVDVVEALIVYPGRVSSRIRAGRICRPLCVRTRGEDTRVPDFPGPSQAARLYPTGFPISWRPTSTGLG